MGPTLIGVGVAFRVWAPHAKQVAVVGTFNNWNSLSNPMQSDEHGHWYAEVKEAKAGGQYKYQLTTEGGVLTRIDPYAREVTSSVGNAIVHNPSFNWEDDDFSIPSWNQLVIYELHVGTFNDEDPCRPGQFISITARNSDWHGYSELFDGYPSSDIEAVEISRDTFPFQASVSIAPYSVLIYSQ